MILIVRKKRLGILKQLMLFMWLVQCVIPNAQAQNRLSRVTENLKNNAVSIQVNYADGSSENGFGIIVGEKNNRFFIVTAGHVIHSKPGVAFQKITLHFYSSFEQFEASEVKWFEEDEDLSLLSCPKPSGMRWDSKFAHFTPSKFNRVRSVGKNQEWDISTEGEISQLSGSIINFKGVDLEPGCSGSPLIGERGIVGMILMDQTTSLKALSLSRIWQLIGKSLRVARWGSYFRFNDFWDDMVLIKGGSFMMGCTTEQDSGCELDERPVHLVALSGFYIGKYEVTQAQWRNVMNGLPSNLSSYSCDDCPVEGVNWQDVQVFIQRLNAKTGKKFRLPTDAEFEYAARGGKQSRGLKYPGSNKLDEVAWYDDSNSHKRVKPVGTKEPNELEIYDLIGNVWEWCLDGGYRAYDNPNPQINPKGTGRPSIRGGSAGNPAKDCRISNRNDCDPEKRDRFLGFRLAHDQ